MGIMTMKKLVVLSGAGISAESGLNTFRDRDGLWEGHDVMAVASIDGFLKNPALVLDFYNQRRAELKTVKPNQAHQLLAELARVFDVSIITQNVDDLHERAGSENVLHLHGELLSIRSSQNPTLKKRHHDPIFVGDKAPDGAQWRPDIVWFGEEVPLMEKAIATVSQADIVLIIGTSLQVYPAAGLYQYAPKTADIFYIDPQADRQILPTRVHKIASTATKGLAELYPLLQQAAAVS